MNHVPYARAFNECETRITLHQRVVAVRRTDDGRLAVELGSEQSPHRSARVVDWVVVDHGCAALDELYHELRPHSTNQGEVDHLALISVRPQTVLRDPDGEFQLFRIGDAVSNRNVHAAVYDALRLLIAV